MIRPGLVSVTFRKLAPAEIVALVKQAGLKGIEWTGDVHVPPGDLGRAREVREITQENGLSVVSYGSYYRVGQSESAGLPFERVLETAVELGAPSIRVWPGSAGSETTSEEGRWKIIHELRRIADLASRALVGVSLEFHGGTLTDTNESASKLMVEVDHSNILLNWQPHNGEETAECVRGLGEVLPRVGNVHVFHWWPTAEERQPLAEGVKRWAKFWPLLRQAPGDRFALLKFVKCDEPAAFLSDAATLLQWLEKAQADT
ncbi:MAG TPA: TIM barrel protein [Rariglobus sp.]|jgi:sugar phosphate isomerase/epimerase|nr:TIM barrel protein [Rariglobus sp.]